MGIGIIVESFRFWKAVIAGDWSAAFDAGKRVVMTFIDWLVGIPGRVWSAVKDVGTSIGEALSEGLRDQLISILNWAIGKINSVAGEVNVSFMGIGGNVNPLAGLHINEIAVPPLRGCISTVRYVAIHPRADIL